MDRFDLCVLGGGPAGFAAAMRAIDLGRRVLLVERDRLGGAGIHRGALSSKTLWELAQDFATAQRTDRGYRAGALSLSYAEVMAAVAAATAERRGLLERQAEALAATGRLTVVRGTGRFVDPHHVEIERSEGTVVRAGADHFLVATGSTPRRLPDLPVDGRRVLTSDHLEDLEDFPRELVVLGAGVVGCEYATIFSRFGRTRVHLIDRERRILPFEDPDVAEVVTASFRAMGMDVHHSCRLARAEARDDGVDCVLEDEHGTETVRASHLLLSIGRAPNTAGLGLAEIGVEVEKNGAIRVRDTATTVPHVYAAGDTTADIALANVAELEGRHAVERMFGVDPKPVRYEALSSILFLAPEVAAVGLNESQAKARGLPYVAARLDNALVPRNIAMRETQGFVKLLAAPDHRLLGLRVVGPHASSTIQGVAFLIDRGGTLEDIDGCIHPHPAIPEGVQECARLLLGRSVHKPEAHAGAMRVVAG